MTVSDIIKRKTEYPSIEEAKRNGWTEPCGVYNGWKKNLKKIILKNAKFDQDYMERFINRYLREENIKIKYI
jgi:hypothetical protein